MKLLRWLAGPVSIRRWEALVFYVLAISLSLDFIEWLWSLR